MIKKFLILAIAAHSLSAYGMQTKSSLPGFMRSYPTVKDEMVDNKVKTNDSDTLKRYEIVKNGCLKPRFGYAMPRANSVVKDRRGNYFEHAVCVSDCRDSHETCGFGCPQVCEDSTHTVSFSDEESLRALNEKIKRDGASIGSFCKKTVEDYYQEKVAASSSSVKKAFLKLNYYFQRNCFLGNLCYFGVPLASLIATGVAARFYVQKKRKNAELEEVEISVEDEQKAEMEEQEAETIVS